MRDLLFALGAILAVEGLLLAIAPRRMEQWLEFLKEMGPERMRYAGLASAALGVAVLLFVR